MRVLVLSALFLLLVASVTTPLSAAGDARLEYDVVPGSVLPFLFLNGAPCGFLGGVSGGGITASVVDEAQGVPTFVKKHIVGVGYAPLTLKFDFSLQQSLYNWISDFLAGQGTPMSVAIYFTDDKFTPISKLQISNAAITEVTIPACNAGSVAPHYLLVTIESPSMQESPAENIDLKQYYSPPKTQKTQQPGHFQLEIDGLDCTYVHTISSITISRAAGTAPGAGTGPGAGALAFSNLHITLRESTTGNWKQWANDFLIGGNNGDQQERSGHLSFLTSDLSTELARVDFHNLGIFGLERPTLDNTVGPTELITVFDLYCERLELSVPGSGAPGAAPSSGAGQTAASAGTAQTTVAAAAGLTPAGVGPERITPNLTKEFAKTEMPGEWCELGKAYTLGKNSPLNVAVNSVEYSAGRIRTNNGYVWPNPDEKFLVVHYAIQNPLREAYRVGRVSIDWTGVDALNANREQDFVGVEGTNVALDQDLKPMQTVECFTIIRVPAKGPVPKLIAAIHGDTEALVARHNLSDKVQPLVAPYADPNDPSGATLVDQIAGTVGNTYMTGAFDVKVDAVNFTTDQVGDQPLPADQEYCLVTHEYTNYGDPGYVLHPQAKLKDDDGVSYEPAFGTLAASSYREIELKPNTGETVKFRLAFLVPKGVALQSLTCKEEDGRPVVIDMSQYKAP